MPTQAERTPHSLALLNGASPGDALIAGLTGAVLGGLTAGISNKIGNLSNVLARAISHGIVSGVRAIIQGGNFLSGFLSSFASTYLQPIGRTLARGSYYGRAFFSAMVGGTVSVIGGGKFANGAVTSAFQFMFNHVLHPDPLTGMPAEMIDKINRAVKSATVKLKHALNPDEWEWLKTAKSDIRASNAQMARLGRGIVDIATRINAHAHPAAKGVLGAAFGIVLTPVGLRVYGAAMANPEAVILTTETMIPIANDVLNYSMPPDTFWGQIKFFWDHRDLEPH